jgi:hypothetical protein
MADGTADVCVCILFYGDDEKCYQLAQRVLNSPMRQLARHNVEFRFGLNAVGAPTRALVHDAVARDFPGALVVEPEKNIFKYPMMRRLLHDRALRAPITMWFDDDSCLSTDCDVAAWLPRVQKLLEAHAMVGSVYRQRLLGNQAEWIKNQWWYAGKPVQSYVKFVTGGWWAIRSEVLLRFDWPLPELKHRGGDVMLGALCEQHGLTLGHFRDQLWINANDEGVESKSPRRGFDEKPIGFYYGKPEPLSREFLLEQGSCCGKRCENCPYDPPYTGGSTKVKP